MNKGLWVWVPEKPQFFLFPCPKHPRYRPTRAPRHRCAQCGRIWRHRDAILFGLEVLKSARAGRKQ